MQTRAFELSFEALPNGDCQILSCRNLREEFGNFLVKEPMIHSVEDFPMHDLLELLEIDDEPGTLINLPLHRNFERVVMAMSIRIIALAEQVLVLFRGEDRIVVIVRGGKFGFAGQVNHGLYSRGSNIDA